MRRKNRSSGAITISTTIAPALWQKCVDKNVSWAECIRIGASFILGKDGEEDFKNPVQMERQLEALADKLQQVANEKEQLETQIKAVRGGLN